MQMRFLTERLRSGVGSVPENSQGKSPFCLRLINVSRQFGDTPAVNDLSLELRRGEFFSLLGPSGCGKTTTLRLIAGFERPDAGTVEILDDNVTHLPPNRRPVNTVFQSYALFAHLNVYENIAFGLKESRTPRSTIAKRVNDALTLVRLAGYERRLPRELSGGEQQRTALARAIVNEPAVLLLDEPLGALDLKLRRAMQRELKALQRRLRIAFLYVTHDQEEALTMSDRVGVMDKGRIVQVGSPEDIYNRPADRHVASFVGEANLLPCRVAGHESKLLILELGDGRRVRAQGKSIGRGEAATLMVRPEQVRCMRLRPGDHEAMLEGVVEEATFVGSFRRYSIRCDDFVITATSLASGNAGPPFAVGEKLELSWDPDQVWAIAEQSQSATRSAGTVDGKSTDIHDGGGLLGKS
jgi:spermidine/putrescine transport system ATP-binding protein